MSRKAKPIDWTDPETVKRFREAHAEARKYGRGQFTFDHQSFRMGDADRVIRYLDWRAAEGLNGRRES